MAQLFQCPNGHYFDPDINPSCPYCSGASVGVDRSFTAPLNLDTPAPSMPIQGGIAEGGYAGGFPTAPVADYAEGAKTMPPFDETQSYTMPVRMNASGEMDDASFVVGWLAAIEGPYKGTSFEIHNGYTTVGREKGDIVLSRDPQVSAVENVSTVYDAENNCFFVAAGASRNLVYINNKALISGQSIELQAYDSIKVGGTKFLFVPFCAPQFSWKNGEAEK